MAKYAVIRLKGRQYKVSEGDEILVDRLSEKPVPEILMIVSEKSVKIGKPQVKEGKVILKVIKDEEKGVKLHVQKYKSKSRYRKRLGFRPIYTRLLVEKISP